MIDALAPLVDSGMMRLVCTDSVDLMGWYSRYAVPEYRLSNIKNFFKFVEKDLLPFVADTCGDDRPPVLAGAGKGVGEEEDTECEQFGEKEDPHGDIAL